MLETPVHAAADADRRCGCALHCPVPRAEPPRDPVVSSLRNALRGGQGQREEPFELAIDYGRRFHAGCVALHGEDHIRTLSSIVNLANVHLSQGSLAQAESLSEAALSSLRRVVGEDHLSTLNARAIRAHSLRRSGRLDEAVPEFREILEARSRSAGDDHPATQGARADLAAALRESGSNAEAESIGRPSP